MNKVVAGILTLGFLARMPGIFTRPLWYDEAFAVLFSSKGPTAMAYGTLAVQAGVAADVHPLGYYTLLWVWGEVIGRSPFLVRLLSLLVGLGVILLGMKLAEAMFNRKVGTVAGILLALSPFQVHYSQEVRMYGLLTLLLLLATYWQWKLLYEPKRWIWIAYGITAAAAQYSHNLAGLYLLPLSTIPILTRNWRSMRWTLQAGGLAILLYLPWLINLPSQFARVRWAYWIPQPGITELVRTFLQFISGLPVPQIGVSEIFFLGATLFLGFLATVLAGISTFRAQQAQRSFTMLIPFYLATAPAALMFLISQWQPVYLDRAMLPSAAMFMIWIAAAISKETLPILYRRTLIGSVAITFLIGLLGFYTYRGFPYAPYAQLNEDISDSIGAGETVLHSNKITAFPAIYYSTGLEHDYLADPSGSGSDTLAPATQEVLEHFAYDNVSQATEGKPGIWFVVFNQEIEDYAAAGIDFHPALSELEKTYLFADRFQLDDLQLIHFSNPSADSLP
jgi:4-amino-4-deoxy-L-arabinose transferase-like glycosyltransferase